MSNTPGNHAPLVSARLPVGHTIRRFDAVASTNDLALAAPTHGVVYVAETQTRGRGRHGHRWESAQGKGLWFSVGLTMEPAGLTFAAALAVRDALAPHAAAAVRWPNDVYIDGFKVCGILVEHRNGQSALGIGLNVCHEAADFPTDLEKPAASLAMVCPRDWEKAVLLQTILSHLDGYISKITAGAYDEVFNAWADATGLIGRTIQRDGQVGTVDAILPDGALRVVTPDAQILRIDGGLIERVD